MRNLAIATNETRITLNVRRPLLNPQPVLHLGYLKDVRPSNSSFKQVSIVAIKLTTPE